MLIILIHSSAKGDQIDIQILHDGKEKQITRFAYRLPMLLFAAITDSVRAKYVSIGFIIIIHD